MLLVASRSLRDPAERLSGEAIDVKTIVLLCGIGLMLLVAALANRRPPAVYLQNQASMDVERFDLRVAGRDVAGGSLARGSLDRQSVPVRQEGPMRLDLRFADGSQREFTVGWFNPGQSDSPRIAILSPDSVKVIHR